MRWDLDRLFIPSDVDDEDCDNDDVADASDVAESEAELDAC